METADLAGPLQLSVTVIVLGLDPLLAAALVGVVAALHAFFEHWNVHTPQWIGVLIKRPAAQFEHHRNGVQAFNYGDFPLWALLPGTFRNPARCDCQCGFETPADRRVGAILGFVDVNSPLCGQGSRGAKPRAQTRSARVPG